MSAGTVDRVETVATQGEAPMAQEIVGEVGEVEHSGDRAATPFGLHAIQGEAAAEREAAPVAEPEAERAGKPVPLRRNLNFQLLWSGSACAFIGMSAAEIAFPLTILGITGSAFKAGLFATLQLAAMIVVGMPAGQFLDRHDRRRVLLLSEGLRAGVFLSVAVTWYLGTLTFWQLLVTALALGAAQPFGAARTLLVRKVVPNEQLTAALTQEEVRNHGSELVGPPLGGALYAVSRALPFVFTTAMFVISFICAFFVRVPQTEQSATTDAPSPAAPVSSAPVQATDGADAHAHTHTHTGGMFSGLKILFGSPIMRATVVTAALLNMVGIALNLCIIVLMRSQNVGPGLTGIVLGAGACGGLLGAALVKPLHKLLQPGWLLIAACTSFTVTVFADAFPHGPWYAAACMFCASLAIPSLGVMVDVLVLRQVPDAVRGRTLGALQTVMGLGMPLGMLSSGLMLQYFSATATMIAAAVGLGVAALYAVSQKALRDARWPEASQAA